MDATAVYEANKNIVAKFIGENTTWYSFYDDHGNEIGKRIYE